MFICTVMWKRLIKPRVMSYATQKRKKSVIIYITFIYTNLLANYKCINYTNLYSK